MNLFTFTCTAQSKAVQSLEAELAHEEESPGQIHICVYVYIYVCIYICIDVCVCVCIHICISG